MGTPTNDLAVLTRWFNDQPQHGQNELHLRMSRLRGRWARTHVSSKRYAAQGATAACDLVRIIEARGYSTKSIKLLGLQIFAARIQPQSASACQRRMISTDLSDRITLLGSGTGMVAEIGKRQPSHASSSLTVFVIALPGICHLSSHNVRSMLARNSTEDRFAFLVSRFSFNSQPRSR